MRASKAVDFIPTHQLDKDILHAYVYIRDEREKTMSRGGQGRRHGREREITGVLQISWGSNPRYPD